MLKRSAFWGWLAVSGIGGLGLMMHAYLASFSRLIADDYCSAYQVRNLGFLRSIWFWYRNWSGGYSTSVADGLLKIAGPYGLSTLIPLFILTWASIIILAAYQFLPAELSRLSRWGWSLCLGLTGLFLLLLLTPNVPQSLFWWGGMRAYSAPLALFTLYLGLFRFWSKRVVVKWAQWLGVCISLVSMFFAAGFSETFTPVQVVLFAGWLALGWWVKFLQPRSPAFSFVLAGLLGALIGLVTMVAAPGNAVRQAFFPPSPNFWGILQISFSAYLAFLAWLVESVERVAGLLALIFLGIWAGLQIPAAWKVRSWYIPAALLNGLTLVFGCFPSAAYGMSERPPDRALIIAVYFLAGNFLIGGYWLGMWLRQTRSMQRWQPVMLTLLLLSLAAASSLNFQRLENSSAAYITYAQEWDAMDAQILAAKASNQAQISIPAKQNWAGLDEPNNNPRFWVTLCMSKYYEIPVFGPNPDLP